MMRTSEPPHQDGRQRRPAYHIPTVSKLSTPHVGSGPAQIGPAVLGASSFACADVLSKVVLRRRRRAHHVGRARRARSRDPLWLDVTRSVARGFWPARDM